MIRPRYLIVIGLVAASALALAACGSDEDDSDSGSGGTTSVPAAAPAPDTAFDAVSTALEGQGLAVAPVPKSSLDGAESGISISGDKSGSARLFKTQPEADAYAKQAAKAGDKTTTVGTVVFQADTEDDAAFFADAYEG